MANDPFLDQLAGLCRDEPARAKWVIVPAHALGLTLGGRLAREGTDWANLRCVTPLDLAVRMAAPFLLERGIDPSEEGLGPALVMRLLLRLPEQGGYFRPMAAQPSMAEALWRAVRELRAAGLRANDLRAEAFVSAAKHAELVALLSAYERSLAEERRADTAAVFEEACRHPDWCPVAADDVVVEAPGTWWPPVVRRFLDALPGRRVAPRDVDVPGAVVPRRFAGRPRSDGQGVGTWAGVAAGGGRLTIFHAGGREAEIDEVLRRIAAAGRPLDQVEIACASDEHVWLAWEKALALRWPVTVADGVPARLTRPGRLLLRLCGWVAGGTAAASLRALLQSGDCAPKAFGGGEQEGDLSTGQAARLLLKAQATWGRHTYARALARLATDYQWRAEAPEASEADRAWHARKASQVRRLAAWVAGVLEPLPEPDADGLVSLAALVSAAQAWLSDNASVASAIDAMALVRVTDALEELRALGDYRCSLAAALGFLEARVEATIVGADRPRPGALHVSRLSGAGDDGRPVVFLVGLQEGGVFPAAVEDPVLLDGERQALSDALPTSTDRLDEAVYGVLTRLTRIGAGGAEVCLSYSCRDTREFRDLYPSWLVLDAFRVQRGDPTLGYQHLLDALGEPASAVPASPAEAVDAASWWMRACVSVPAARARIVEAFPRLASGLAAEQARESPEFTAFDGWVPAAGDLLDPTRSGRPVSASTLEQAANCPFSHFLRQALGVRPIEESARDADVWLTAQARGSELHALFARLVRTLRDEGRAPDRARDLMMLHEWADERLRDLREEVPPPSEEVFERERKGVLDDLRAFLDAECEGLHGNRPVGIEVSFGLPVDGDEPEALSSPAPVPIALDAHPPVMLRGRIDRINVIAPGEIEVIDYKTGGYWDAGWQGRFAGGTRLQHALYGLAAEELFRRRGETVSVVQGRYLFPAVRGRRRQKVIAAPGRETLGRVLGSLVRVLAGGSFIVSPATDGCRYCQFAAACHAVGPGADDRSEETRAARKVEHAANTMLAAFRELRSHE